MNGSLCFYDYHPAPEDFESAVLEGLCRWPKQIAPKYFYDQRGSELFDAITELPEYYPTRTEIRILEDNGERIADFLGGDCMLVELGSGSSRKIRVLLDALQPAAYVPLDISREHLLNSAEALANDYPQLQVHAACTDYSTDFDIPGFEYRQFRAGRGAGVAAACRAAFGRGGQTADRCRSQEGQCHFARRLQRCTGSDRGFQS
jgi:uncharacterized SAM-dependent methyltransferase